MKRLLKSVPYRWLIPKFDACLAAGRWSTDYFLHYGARREKIFLVPHVIDEGRFLSDRAPSQPCREEFRRKWDLGQDDLVFLFVGKFTEDKRPLDFVRAINLASGREAQIKGLMVGDGPLRHECEQFTSAAKAPVRFTGFLNQSQISSAYVACDVIVLPSQSETWGMVINEAMSSQRPCIVSDRVGCGPDLVTPGETGFVFPLGHVESLVSHMSRCAADRAGLNRMGERARDRLARYSIAAAVEGVLRALSSTRAGSLGARA